MQLIKHYEPDDCNNDIINHTWNTILARFPYVGRNHSKVRIGSGTQTMVLIVMIIDSAYDSLLLGFSRYHLAITCVPTKNLEVAASRGRFSLAEPALRDMPRPPMELSFRSNSLLGCFSTVDGNTVSQKYKSN